MLLNPTHCYRILFIALLTLMSCSTIANADIQDQLVEAAHAGDTITIRKLLAQGVDPNIPNAKGLMPLRALVLGDRDPTLHAQYVRAATLLLDRGANVNDAKPKGSTIIRSALWSPQQSVAMIELLLEHEADPNFVEPMTGTAPLHTELLWLDTHTENNTTHPNAIAVLSMLLNAGADPNANDNDGQTPLDYAIKLGNIKVLELLLAHGADINKKSGNYSLAYLSLIYNKPKMTVFLLQQGIATDAEDFLSYAIRKGDNDLLQQFLQLGVNPNTPSKRKKIPPLIQAVKKNNKQAVSALINYGADVQLKDTNSKTALDYAREKQLDDIALIITKSRK